MALSVLTIQVENRSSGQTSAFHAVVNKLGQFYGLDGGDAGEEASGEASASFEIRGRYVGLSLQTKGATAKIALGPEAFLLVAEVFLAEFGRAQDGHYWTEDDRRAFVEDFATIVLDLLENLPPKEKSAR